MNFRRRLPLDALPASTAAGTRIYAVGDIHGHLDLLDRMLDAIDADLVARPHERPELIFLGDYVDRGPSSAGVVHRLVEVTETYGAACLMGNHEAVLAAFLADPGVFEHWRAMGCLPTLRSYGISLDGFPSHYEAEAASADLNHNLPDRHRSFLRNLPLTRVSGDYFFVHAGIRPKVALNRQSKKDLLWIRDEFGSWTDPFEKFVVHGHTPVPAPDVRSNRINIDTGAYATGRLTCLILENDKRWLMQT